MREECRSTIQTAAPRCPESVYPLNSACALLTELRRSSVARRRLRVAIITALIVGATSRPATTQNNDVRRVTASNTLRTAADPSRRVPQARVPQTRTQTPAPAPTSPTPTSWSERTRAKSADKSHERPVTTLSTWTAVGALAFVLGLIGILARLFRKHAPMFQQGLPPEALEILGRRFIDQRQAILLVRIGSRILVVGSSPSGLQPLGEVTDPVEVDLVAGLCHRNENRGIGSSFVQLLSGQFASQPKAPTRTPQSAARREPASGPVTTASTAGRGADEPTVPFSHPEYELMRRLRGGPPRHAESQEGVHG
jgi:flagellar biogenesis protein FliO